MKKRLTILLILCFCIVKAQPPAFNFWITGGNPPIGPSAVTAVNNIMGTTPANLINLVRFQTVGLERFRMFSIGGTLPLQNYVGSLTCPFPAGSQRMTRMMISRDGANPITRPLSLLHLGYQSAFVGTAIGHRSWQDIGTMYMAESDNFYVGMRQKLASDLTGRTSTVLANPDNAQDAVISWGDNYSGQPPPPDNNLAFIFHTQLGLNADFPATDYGREVMRMNGEGNVGIGPQFFDNQQPTNMLHINNSSTVQAYVQITNRGVTGQTFGDGFHLGITGGAAGGIAELNQKENSFMRFFTNNTMRMFLKDGNNTTPCFGGNNQGYIGISPQTSLNPLFNIDMQTPAQATGELFFGATPSDVPLSRAMIMNATSQTGRILPTFMGNIDISQVGPAMQTVGSIDPANDLAPGVNNESVHRFIVGKNYDYYCNGLSNLNEIQNRIAFTWHNGPIIKMMMNSSGQLRIGTALTIPATLPNNRIEITSALIDPYGIAGSGLRFTNLTSANAIVPNGVNGVVSSKLLTVDQNGDVVLTTPTVTGGGVGNYCLPGPANPLTGDYEIPTGTFKYRFTGQSIISPAPGAQQDMVSIGYACGSSLPVSKFNVLEAQTGPTPTFDNYAGYFVNKNLTVPGFGAIAAGVYGEAKAPTGPPSTSEPMNVGGVFEGYGNFFSVGVMGRIVKRSKPNVVASSGYAIGGVFLSDTNVTNTFGPATNFGVYARASKGFANYGIYAEAVPTGTNGPNYSGYFNGDVVRTGNDNFTSDQILKQNVDTITNALGIISQLQPKTFTYKTNTYPQMGLPTGQQFGLIAQQVQTVVPALINNAVHPEMVFNNVSYPAVNYLTLEYQQLIPIMIKAIQQLSAQNQSLVTQMQSLTQTINNCCENQQARQTGINGNGANAQQQVLNQLNIDLSDKDVIVLNQNVPNPYAENTTITYNIPVQYSFAQIVFKTVEGKILRTVDIDKKGKGQLNVFASDLSNGLYMYTLIVDGKEFDTKKMVKGN